MKRLWSIVLLLSLLLTACTTNPTPTAVESEVSEETEAREGTTNETASEPPTFTAELEPIPTEFHELVNEKWRQPQELELTAKAEQYVKKYLSLIIGELKSDLYEGTAQGEQDPGELSFQGTAYTLEDLLNSLDEYVNFTVEHTFLVKENAQKDVQRQQMETSMEVMGVEIEDTMACVEIYSQTELFYTVENPNPYEVYHPNIQEDVHKIYFANLNGWKIVTAYSQLMQGCGYELSIPMTEAYGKDKMPFRRPKQWREAPYQKGEIPPLPPEQFQRYGRFRSGQRPVYFYVYIGTERDVDFPEWGLKIHIPEEWMGPGYLAVEYDSIQMSAYLGNSELSRRLCFFDEYFYKLNADFNLRIRAQRRDTVSEFSRSFYTESMQNSLAFFEVRNREQHFSDNTGNTDRILCHQYMEAFGEAAFWDLADTMRCSQDMKSEIVEIYEP